MACCDYEIFDKAFDKELAEQELNEYLSTGLKKSSRPLMHVLNALPVHGKSLLDIGGGIGAITFELFAKSIQSAVHVDLSKASVDTFRAEVNRRSLRHKVESLHGDFLSHSDAISTSDLVILDKVICCYEDMEQLVNHSVRKAKYWYVYSIPRNSWLVRFRFFLDDVSDWLNGRYIPVYFHSNTAIEAIAVGAGFQKTMELLDGNWRVVVFEK